MNKILCWVFGHKAWKPYNGDFFDPYCVRCEKHPTLAQVLRDAFKR